MNILVTGGKGFIGSHLVDLLCTNDNNTVVALDSGFNSNRHHNPKANYIYLHTKDIDRIDFQPDIIYHLGEYARVTPSFKEPELVYDLNIVGTFAVVQYCLKNGCKLVYGASSTKFTDPNESPYTFSKSTNVQLIKNYGRWYGLDYAICYFYNAFGPREIGSGKYATLIAKFQEAYKSGKSLTVVNPGTQKRNFTYVKDIVAGIALVGEKGDGDDYALNNPRAYSIKEIAQAFSGGTIKYIDGAPGRSNSGTIPTKAYELGWQTTVDVINYIRSNMYQQ